MIELRQAVQTKHAETGGETREEDRPFVRRYDKRRPGEEWTAGNVERISPHIDPGLHQVCRGDTHQTAQQAQQRNARLVEVQRLRSLFYRVGRVAFHAAISRLPRLCGCIDQIAWRVELGHKAVYPFVDWHQTVSSITVSEFAPPGLTLV